MTLRNSPTSSDAPEPSSVTLAEQSTPLTDPCSWIIGAPLHVPMPVDVPLAPRTDMWSKHIELLSDSVETPAEPTVRLLPYEWCWAKAILLSPLIVNLSPEECLIWRLYNLNQTLKVSLPTDIYPQTPRYNDLQVHRAAISECLDSLSLLGKQSVLFSKAPDDYSVHVPTDRGRLLAFKMCAEARSLMTLRPWRVVMYQASAQDNPPCNESPRTVRSTIVLARSEDECRQLIGSSVWGGSMEIICVTEDVAMLQEWEQMAKWDIHTAPVAVEESRDSQSRYSMLFDIFLGGRMFSPSGSYVLQQDILRNLPPVRRGHMCRIMDNDAHDLDEDIANLFDVESLDFEDDGYRILSRGHILVAKYDEGETSGYALLRSELMLRIMQAHARLLSKDNATPP